MVFTEFLYKKDEVTASFMVSMMFNTNIEESTFYICELYNSGFYEDVYNILYQLYFDFYYITNPEYLKKINDIISNDKEKKDVTNIIYIVKWLFYSDKCIPVFLLNQHMKIYNSKQKITVFRGKTPKWLENFNTVSHKLLRSIEKFNWKNITYYIHISTNEQIEIMYKDTLKYLNDKKKKILLDYSVNYENKKHMLISLILINYSNVIVESSVVEKFTTDYEEPVYDKIKPRNLLKTNRKFQIKSELIDAFKLERHDISRKEHMDKLLYSWEYFCKDTPIWKKRFTEYEATFNEKINFPNEDLLENFYEKYSLEPDEQNMETLKKSHAELDDIKPKEFLSQLLVKLHATSVTVPDSLLEFFVSFEENNKDKYLL